jgi:RNA polymerase sigma-70 factor (family 1)
LILFYYYFGCPIIYQRSAGTFFSGGIADKIYYPIIIRCFRLCAMNKCDNESELIRLVADGDREAFAQLYTQHIHNLYRYIYAICRSKEISEEIVQDIFVKLWTNRKNLNSINSFKAYLYRSAKNMLLNQIKKNKVKERVLALVHPNTEESTERSDEKIIYDQYFAMAQKAINLLPEKRRQIVELRTKEDLTLDEIAAKLNISKSVVKKQLYSGMDFVKKYLCKYGELTGFLVIYILLIIRR